MERFFSPQQTFAVRTHLRDSFLTNSLYCSQLVKDAIVDRLRNISGQRPAVQVENPDLLFDCRLYKNRLLLSFDLSASPFYQRAYRSRQLQASLKENLAAALVEWSQWHYGQPLADIFSGSGTIIFEAIYKAFNLPGGLLRKRFGFFNLEEFDRQNFDLLRKNWNYQIPETRLKIFCSDSDASALKAVSANWRNFPEWVRRAVELTQQKSDFRQLKGFSGFCLISNPPYGYRLQSEENLSLLYKDLGDFLKRKCPASKAFLLVGDLQLIKKIGLRPSWRRIVFNGPIECRFLKYELY